MNELDAYDYEVPRELVAQFPLARRTDARLMVVNRGQDSIEHHHIRDLPSLLGVGDMLVLNDTKVLPARLTGHRERTMGRWNGLFLDDQDGLWRVLGRTRGKLTPGEWIALQDRDARSSLRLQCVGRDEYGRWIMAPEKLEPAFDLLAKVGRVPLPPYIRGGNMVETDEADYQTVFAERPGAVAAPTAGLHFTAPLLEKLRSSGVSMRRVTLHVGAGTFQPVAVARLDQHVMHQEWAEVSDESARAITEHRAAGGRVIAVGTTVVRTLETAAAGMTTAAHCGPTQLFIRSPYQFQAVDALLTNFHFPRSTLLILVSAFGGEALIRRAYREAISEQYRLFSYGDAMLIV